MTVINTDTNLLGCGTGRIGLNWLVGRNLPGEAAGEVDRITDTRDRIPLKSPLLDSSADADTDLGLKEEGER